MLFFNLQTVKVKFLITIFFLFPHFRLTLITIMSMKRKNCSNTDYPTVFGPSVKHEKEEEDIWEILPLETEVKMDPSPTPTWRAMRRNRCDLAYDSGCICRDCIKKWREKPMWKRGPRCMMCPLMIKRDLGDGVCCGYCKNSLLEVQDYPFHGKGPNGEPAFKKSFYGERRNDKL